MCIRDRNKCYRFVFINTVYSLCLKYIRKWSYVDERLLSLETVESLSGIVMTVMVAYGPNEDEAVEKQVEPPCFNYLTVWPNILDSGYYNFKSLKKNNLINLLVFTNL